MFDERRDGSEDNSPLQVYRFYGQLQVVERVVVPGEPSPLRDREQERLYVPRTPPGPSLCRSRIWRQLEGT